MAVVPVSQLNSGDKLIEDVLTKLGNILFHKGRVIAPREIEILRAFMIPYVDIEVIEEDGERGEVKEEESELPFYIEYHNTLQLLKRVFRNAMAGANLPVLDIRNTMEALLSKIQHYHVLKFSPKTMGMSEYIYHNSIMVALTSYQLAKWHGFTTKDLMPIALAGLLHDIGNVKIDSVILEKPTRLTTAELEEMRKHTVYGYQILKNVPSINEGVKLCALQHHEKEDGSGYPLALKGDNIHPYAKVVAVADIFHAMTGARTYKKAESPYIVLEQLTKDSFGKLDPTLVQTFINKVTQFHQGTVVRLSDNRVGEIIFTDRAHPTRPMVNVGGTIINLAVDRKLFIQEVMS
ncbi:HD-GYP domain-containing protein [Paenibacillus koleovorans]|uniref:HD-GYP domain-containing protein n=1 Tax=Paenibacillus koleovorans TaxID=121608 RepID=UPI000FD72F81|nr:HD-GYP domain-containing protein [Paenibacillus koleovorans]